MALNQHCDLYDLLHKRFGGKKEYYRMSRIEKEYLKNLSIKRDDKSLRRVADIKMRIKNDLNKNCFNKKYQIQSFYEYKMIKESTYVQAANQFGTSVGVAHIIGFKTKIMHSEIQIKK
jgi:hypothetical protein